MIFTFSTQWPRETVDFIQELLEASSNIYFDVIAHDSKSKLYGEIYLTIEDQNIALKKLLIHKLMATSYDKSKCSNSINYQKNF